MHQVDYQEGNHYNDETYSRDNVDENVSEMFDFCKVRKCFDDDYVEDEYWCEKFDVYDKKVKFELDSGAECNILSLGTVLELGLETEMSPSNKVINGVHDKAEKAMGSISIPCVYKGKAYNVNCQVLNTKRNINLLGKHDCRKMKLIQRVNKCDVESEKLVLEFSDVLCEDEIGCIPGTYHIKVDESIEPVEHAPRILPAPIREQVKQELERLESLGIIEKVEEPESWVNSLVTVRKKNGKVRICIDPTDLNKAIKREHYPMSTIDDILTRMPHSKHFSVLDANMGYFQIRLSDESSGLTTFNTPFGRYKYLRMPMGIKSSSDVFQRKMTEIFGDIEGVEIVIDDVLVHGATREEHDMRLRKVLQRAREANLKFNKSKCKIAASEVSYIGHKLTDQGVQPSDDKVQAIAKMRSPENKGEVETMLGMLAYLAKFIPNLSEISAPLRRLKRHDVEWSWSEEEEEAFKKIKKILCQNQCSSTTTKTKPSH